ncbi:hypothetical protein EV421DRAFT_1891922 [Armillaria borealis]|uniref:N-acetyltransferase domain-containing protein n=1 Tax=Armillaria borealis TaxID=47425 RepID=A0AA39J9E2_9AGAR|nr:hypothetical protein EV421DRAFT_1891922 [Armillaria borealis]
MTVSNSETFKLLLLAQDLSDVICKPITSQQTIPLRHSVLWPGENAAKVILPADELGWHFGAFVPSRVEPIAVISLFTESVPMNPIDSTLDRLTVDDPAVEGMATRFRKFACDPLFQGRGIGTKLLTYVFHFSRLNLHARVVWCDARVSASSWYRKRSMIPFGNTFFKGTVEYVRMRIDLELLTP